MEIKRSKTVLIEDGDGWRISFTRANRTHIVIGLHWNDKQLPTYEYALDANEWFRLILEMEYDA